MIKGLGFIYRSKSLNFGVLDFMIREVGLYLERFFMVGI